MSGILSKLYIVSILTPDGQLHSRTETTVKRKAIRQLRKNILVDIGYRGDVRTKEDTLVYQAHVDENGRVVSEEL